MTDAVTPTNNAAPAETPVQATAQPDVKLEHAPTPAEIRKLKLKIDGQEFEHTEEEVIAMAQRGKAGDRAMKEAAQLRKQNQEIVRRLKTDPLGLLKDPSLGHDVKKMISDYLRNEMQEANLTPKQREERDLRNKLKSYEEKEAASKKAEQDKLIKEHASKYQAQLETQMQDVLKTSGLPKTNYTVQRVVHYMQIALKEGYENVEPKDVIPLVKQDYITAQQDLYSAADEDTLISLLGDDLLGKVSKAYLKKTGKAAVVERTDKPQVVGEKKQEAQSYRSLKEWSRS